MDLPVKFGRPSGKSTSIIFWYELQKGGMTARAGGHQLSLMHSFHSTGIIFEVSEVDHVKPFNSFKPASHQFRVKNRIFHVTFKVLNELCPVSLSNVSFSNFIFRVNIYWLFLSLHMDLYQAVCLEVSSVTWQLRGMANGHWGLVCAWVLGKVETVIGAVLVTVPRFSLWCSGGCTNTREFTDHTPARSPGELIKLGW